MSWQKKCFQILRGAIFLSGTILGEIGAELPITADSAFREGVSCDVSSALRMFDGTRISNR